jgi:hypothetical protein
MSRQVDVEDINNYITAHLEVNEYNKLLIEILHGKSLSEDDNNKFAKLGINFEQNQNLISNFCLKSVIPTTLGARFMLDELKRCIN